ncbi:hypothetical protein K1T71_002475 [Dendrolimus kikuchii]|uniref:Uncharacterized protein n=1 Tax=Dendrolimus kikuchii TaxID=765133 RepID=A0ACC1DDR1_9NEOP|nr:hypothetical protein K1T71_002475 [Dendrolimus kikuchii]
MDIHITKLKEIIVSNNEEELIHWLNSGLNPNFEGGWPIRLAARYGFYSIVKALIQFGANPHLLGESGASTLQLAVFSGQHWNTDKWTFLLSCSDSSQLADGAAVAIIFQNAAALKNIIATGRCNKNVPTTLTGKTLEALAKGYKQSHLLHDAHDVEGETSYSTIDSPRNRRQHRSVTRTVLDAPHPQRVLSPSVERFFNQTAGQHSLSPHRRLTYNTSPNTERFHN